MQSSGYANVTGGDKEYGFQPPPQPPPSPFPLPPPPRQQNPSDHFVSSSFLNNISPLNSSLDQFLWSRQLIRPVGPQDLTAVIATSSPPPPTPPTQKLSTFSAAGPILEQNNSYGNNNKITGRNSRKRSRASKRTPTTVLTTDTANFRAMVQEFTGIPAPPFTGLLPSTSSHLLRPFAQRLKYPSPFLPPSSSSSNSAPLTYFQNFPNSNTQNLTNPIHNLHHSTNPFANSSDFTAKSKPLHDSNQGSDAVHQILKVGTHFFEEFGHDIASSSSASHGNALQTDENGQEKVHIGIMESVNGGYRDLQRRLGE